ncbi:MAG: Sterol-binding domain protein [Gammaproteobacteria bacterium]|jgi:ubiquinone biosynthesis protein UbiJ|nr:Sterol-binding domain protein [Gammaproteobacteria bacterium]
MLLTFFLLPIEKLLNRYLQLDAENFARLQKLTGKTLAIELAGLELSFYLVVSGRGLQFCETIPHPADARVRGMPFTLASMLINSDPLTQIRSGDVTITGDVEFVQALQQWLKSLNIDWEEQLAHYCGDNMASQLADCFYSVKDWQQETKQAFTQNFSEYLQEEIRHFPPREEVYDFGQDVAELRLATDRLQARMQRLENILKESR